MIEQFQAATHVVWYVLSSLALCAILVAVRFTVVRFTR
jgi:hypothetical protein